MYVNNKRVATGKAWNNQFLQLHPEKKTFASEAEWRSQIYQWILNSIWFHVETPKESKKTTPVKAITPVKSSTPVKASPPVIPSAPVKPPKEKEGESDNWVCGYCCLPAGNDHRMCICNGYRYSVQLWEEGRIFPQKALSSSTPTPTPSPVATQTQPVSDTVSLNPRDWSYTNKRKAVLPPGRYYIGDLCYALHDTLYHKVYGSEYEDGLYVSNLNPNHLFMMGGTGGDGIFSGSDGKEYCVDAGIIGIAAEATLDKSKDCFEEGSMFTFNSPVEVTFKFDDKFTFCGQDYRDPQLTIYMFEDEEETYEDSE